MDLVKKGPYRDGLLARQRQLRGGHGCPRLAKAIRQARRKAGLTQAAVALALSVSRAQVASWENAQRRVAWQDFERLSDLLRDGPYDWAAVESRVKQLRPRPFMALPAEDGEADEGGEDG